MHKGMNEQGRGGVLVGSRDESGGDKDIRASAALLQPPDLPLDPQKGQVSPGPTAVVPRPLYPCPPILRGLEKGLQQQVRCYF